jgi:hypothetical protein
VALKVIRSDRLQEMDPATRAKWIDHFRTEAQALELEHEHMVPLYEVGESNAQVYYTMHYIAGNRQSGTSPPDRPFDLAGTSSESGVELP